MAKFKESILLSEFMLLKIKSSQYMERDISHGFSDSVTEIVSVAKVLTTGPYLETREYLYAIIRNRDSIPI